MEKKYNIKDIKKNKKKFTKEKTLKSLMEVEVFLSNLKKAKKGIRIYKALR